MYRLFRQTSSALWGIFKICCTRFLRFLFRLHEFKPFVGSFFLLFSSKCQTQEKWTLSKLIGFMVNISNADFAIKIDATIRNDINDFIDLMKAKCSNELEIIIPYKIVVALK